MLHFITRIKDISIGFVVLICLFSFDLNAQKSPNIILFMVDDMGWQDCSVPFWTEATKRNQLYHTPNMERLAREGMKFTNAYATPVCSPTRVSLMTGMNAAHHKVTNWTLRKDQSVDYFDSLFMPPAWNVNGMSAVGAINHTVLATPLPALLKEAGYFSIHCGKAHFGAMGTPASNPIHLGFDMNIAGHAAGGLGSHSGERNYGNEINQHTLPWGVPGLEEYHGTETFLTEALTLKAIQALAYPLAEKRPFFLYLSHYAVHIPLESDKRFYSKYLDAGMAEPEAKYASMIEGMDKSLGDLLKYLEEKHLDRNTVILFMSDNGGFSLPPREGRAFTHNYPLKAGKGSVYEGGIREPMLVKWPGVVKPGTVCNQYLIIEDFFPTLLEIAGIRKFKSIQTVDGISFVPLLKNPALKQKERELIWHFPNKWIAEDGPGVNYHSAIRKGRWKLVYNMKTGKQELYDLQADLSELHDLSVQYPVRVKTLSAILADRLRNWEALMPTFRDKGYTAAMPDGQR